RMLKLHRTAQCVRPLLRRAQLLQNRTAVRRAERSGGSGGVKMPDASRSWRSQGSCENKRQLARGDTMAGQSLTLSVPQALYEEIKARADRAQRSVEEETLDLLASAAPAGDELPPDSAEAVA